MRPLHLVLALALSLCASVSAAQDGGVADGGMEGSDAGAADASAEVEPREPLQEAGSGEEGAAQLPPPPAEEEEGDERRLIRYSLEDVRVEGNTSTADFVVKRFVPVEPGDVLDVDDPALEEVRWRLLGTGWFKQVELRLQKGSRPGWVVLIVRVEERNTILVQQLAFGVSQGVDRTSDASTEIQPYLGLTVSDTNFLGLGKYLSASALVSKRQQGLRLRYQDPVFLDSKFSLRAELSYRNGMEFFGEDPLVSITCPPPEDPEDECPPEVEARNAVVLYKRYGMRLGLGHDITAFTRYSLDWQIDVVDPSVLPNAASETRGTGVDPVNVHLQRGVSLHSAFRIALDYDRRNDPAFTTEGTLVSFSGGLGTSFLGSEYEYLKLQAMARYWAPLGGDHYLRLGVFAGFLSGEAPFFERFYASDLSDAIPSRLLEMSVDRRSAPNLLDTAVAEFRTGDIAGRVDLEYGVPLYRDSGFLRSVHGYLGAGIFGVATRDHLRFATPGYEGLSAVPFDLTFDLGLRADTSVGVFQLGLSTLLGFFVL